MKERRLKQCFWASISTFDIILYCTIACGCFFLFQYTNDLSHTASCAFAILNGHIMDFYEYNMAVLGEINYYPTVYILLALWNLPMKLLGFQVEPTVNLALPILLWNKLFLVIIYLATVYVIYKICIRLKFNEKKAKRCAFAWSITPIAFFVQFSLGMYDIIPLFLMLVGLYFYFDSQKQSWYIFILCFAIAITCKTFPLFYFAVLLLLKEKNIFKIIRDAILVVIPLSVEILININSSAFREGVLGWNITDLYMVSTVWLNNLFIIACLLIFAYAYFTEIELEMQFKWALYFCNLVSFCYFALCLNHPNWFMYMTPFIILTLFLHKRFNAYAGIILILSCSYFVFFANMPGPHSEGLIDGGILGKNGIDIVSSIFKMRGFYIIQNQILIFSILSACVIILAIFSHPKYCDDIVVTDLDWCWFKATSLVGSLFFIIPCLLSAFPVLGLEGIVFDSSLYNEGGVTGILTDKKFVEQRFFALSNEVTRIKVLPITWNRSYPEDSEIVVELVDLDTNDILTLTTIKQSEFKDRQPYVIDFDDTALIKKKWYSIRFSGNRVSEQESIQFLCSTSGWEREDSGYAVINGEKQPYNMGMIIYGK